MGEGLNHRTVGDDSVFNHAVGADFDVVTQHHIAFEYAVHIDNHVLAVLQLAAQIEAGRIAQGDTGFQQRFGLVALENTL